MNGKFILVVGGAGFIGSHVNKMLHRKGYQTIVLDNLSHGFREAVREGIFVEGDLAHPPTLHEIFKTYPIEAIMHFAACIDVGESVAHPGKYYLNNVSYALNLLLTAVHYQVKTFIFSSSAAVYGNPLMQRITEEHSCHPINPYGESKWMIEKMLRDFDAAYDLKYSSLRYFNAAGGDPEGEIKNYQKHSSNLIPRILLSLRKEEGKIKIFGTDYSTRDGTCIRDYIHIEDLGEAHITAMESLFGGAPSSHYNLGSGNGFTVREVIQTIESKLGKKIEVIESPRRQGDPPILLADSSKALRELNWQPRFSLPEMIEHAWNAYSLDYTRSS